MNLYATVNQYHLYSATLTSVASLANSDVNRILRNLNSASRFIDSYCKRHFYPQSATYYFDYLNPWEIRFAPHDLVEASVVTSYGGDETIDSDDYWLVTGDAHNLYPKDRLLIKRSSGSTLGVSDDYERSNAVTGTWCFHQDWDNAWSDTLDTVQDDPLTSSMTSLTVNDSDGVDGSGFTPRFQRGQTLKVGEEWLYVAAVDDDTDTLTVQRGRNGSTAAEHAQGATIYVFSPEQDIFRACLILADYFDELPQAPFGVMQSLESEYATPLSIPKTASQLLAPHENVHIGTRTTSRKGGRLYLWGIDPFEGKP